jgi:hypothetical protein
MGRVVTSCLRPSRVFLLSPYFGRRGEDELLAEKLPNTKSLEGVRSLEGVAFSGRFLMWRKAPIKR